MSNLLDSNGHPIDDGQGQTLTDHLSELRDRLIKSAYGILAMMVVAWNFREKVLESIVAPVQQYLPNGKLIFLSPTDMFMAHIKITAMLGIIFSCPIWLYQLWKFISPGLYAHEKKYSVAFIGSGVGLFLLGSGFCYFLVLPAALKFLLQEFGSSVGQAMLTLEEYLSFFVTMILVFGAAFEMPLIIVLLGLFGIVDQKFLREKRRYAIVILAIVAAIVTPPDLLSMLMLLVPLMVLYEISILIVGLLGRRKAPEDSRI